jgi:ketosteroid isomerase-like protein
MVSLGSLQSIVILNKEAKLRRFLTCITLAVAVPVFTTGQMKGNKVEEELLKTEKAFSQAIVSNDSEAIGRILADEWIIIDSEGGLIDKTRFLDVIKSGTLTHELMESADARVRIYGDTAIVTVMATSKGKYSGQAFTTHERATDVFVKKKGRWRCVHSQLSKFTQWPS